MRLHVKILAFWQNPPWKKNDISQETGCNSLLLYLDLGNKEKLNWLDIKNQRNLKSKDEFVCLHVKTLAFYKTKDYFKCTSRTQEPREG